MIKVALFDVGGVLVTSTTNAVSKALSDLGLTEAQVDEVWDDYIDSQLGCGLIDEWQFWQEVCSKYKLRSVTVEENLLGRPYQEAVMPNESVLFIAWTLKERGLTLAILSDTIEPHARVMRAMGIFGDFDHIFFSHEIGCRKPNVETFRLVVDRLGVSPDEVVFIDDRSDNVESAAALGMRGIVFRDAGQLTKEIQNVLS
ncbi:MAG: HAD family phosphatase [Patescibacteria group bacterium]